jgi:esterase FrsA
VASFDLPCHGERIDEFGEGIVGFRNAFVSGVDPFAAFVADGRAVITECIQRGWAQPHRIAAAGTSRGGYMALRLMAADERIAACAGFAPVTDWRYLSEFQGDAHRTTVANLRLARFANRLVGRRVYLAIGPADERVSTESCRRLHHELLEANAQAGFDDSHAELNLTDDPGHSMGVSGYQKGAEFLLRWCAAARNPGSSA